MNNIMSAGLDSSGYVNGAKVITKANLDIMDSTNKAHSAINALEGRFGGIGNHANRGFGAAKDALKQMESPLAGVKNMIEQVESRIIRIGATVLAFRLLGSAVGAVTGFFKGGILAVRDYQDTIISISAGLTQIAILQEKQYSTGKGIPEMYADSARYAGVLAEKMREVDRNSYANYDQIMQMLGVYTSTGKVLDVNNKKQMEGWTALSNAIPIMTKGQDITRQMTTEMRALATGTTTAGSTIARAMDSMLKADKSSGYANGLKDVIKESQKTGVSVLELLAPYLQGFTAALPQIQQTLTNAQTSLETAIGNAQRKTFKPIVEDLVAIIQGGIVTIGDSTNTVASIVQGSWKKLRDVIFDVKESVDEAGNATRAITIKPEIMEGMKKVGDVFLWAGAIIRDSSGWIISHLNLLTTLGIAYGLRKAAVIAVSLATKSSIEYQKIQNAAKAESIAITMRQIEAENILAATRMKADGSLIKAAPGVIRTETNLYNAQQTQAQTAANLELANSELRVAQTTAANTQAKMMNAVATRNSLLVEVTSLQMKADQLVVTANMTASTLAYAELKRTEAIAIHQSNAAILQSTILEKEMAISTETSVARQTVLKAELRQANLQLLGVNQLLTVSESEVTAARQANDVATQKAIIATDVLNVSKKSLAMAEEIAAKAAGSNTLAVNAVTSAITKQRIAEVAATGSKQALIAANFRHLATVEAEILANTVNTEVLVKSTMATRLAALADGGLAVAKTALSGALTLVGGGLGAITLALYFGYLAWEKYGNAAEKAKKQAKVDMDEGDNAIAEMDKEIKRYEQQQRNLQRIKDGLSVSVEDKVMASTNSEQLEKYNKELDRTTNLYNKAKQAFELNDKSGYGEGLAGKVGKIAKSNELQGKMDDASAEMNRANTAKKIFLERQSRLAEINDVKAPIQPKINPDEKQDYTAHNDGVNAYNALILAMDAWELRAVRSGKVQDELGAKIDAVNTEINNTIKQYEAANIFGQDTKDMTDYIEAQGNIIITNAVIADSKKQQATLDKANAQASLQEFRSDLETRKSELQNSLEDQTITQKEYYTSWGAFIKEESSREIQELQKVVDEKKAILSEALENGPVNAGGLQADVVKATTELDRFRAESTRKYQANINAENRYLREQAKLIISLKAQNEADLLSAKGDTFGAKDIMNKSEIDKMKEDRIDPEIIKGKELAQEATKYNELLTAQGAAYSNIIGRANEAFDVKVKLIDLEAAKLKSAGVSEVAIQDWVTQETKRAYIERARANESLKEGMIAGFKEIELQQKTYGELGYQAMMGIYTNMSTAFSTIFMDAFEGKLKKGVDYIKDFAKSILKIFLNMIAEIIAKWVMMQTMMAGAKLAGGVMGMFGSGVGASGGAGSAVGSAGSMGGSAVSSTGNLGGSAISSAGSVGGWHSGGTYGEASSTSIVNNNIFNNAPKFHNGLKPNEFPAILEKTEGVFTAGQMKALGNNLAMTNLERLNASKATMQLIMESERKGEVPNRLYSDNHPKFVESKADQQASPTQSKEGNSLVVNVPITGDFSSKKMASELRNEIEATVERVVRRHS